MNTLDISRNGEKRMKDDKPHFSKEELERVKEQIQSSMDSSKGNTDTSQGPTLHQLQDRMKVIQRLIDGESIKKTGDKNPGIK